MTAIKRVANLIIVSVVFGLAFSLAVCSLF